MHAAIECKFGNELISIEKAIELKVNFKTTNKLDFLCIECNEPVRAHKASHNTAAHFEHLHKNDSCSHCTGVSKPKSSSNSKKATHDSMNSVCFSEIIKAIYELVSELEGMFPGRHFTPDGHMVGSIGEVWAAHHYGLQLLPASTKGYDATKDGKRVEIKITQGTRVAFRSEPEHALVLKIHKDGSFTEIYNGAGGRIWQEFSNKNLPRNGQFTVSLKKLEELNCAVAAQERIQRLILK